MTVGTAVVGAAVGAGVGDGGAVVATGAVVTGAAVLVLIDTVEVGDADGSAESDTLGLDEIAGDTDAGRAKKMTAMTRSVRRLPTTAARPRSIQRGPRRGGRTILVVSPGMP